jgi:hypothetical protein
VADAHVVDDEDVGGREKPGKVREGPVRDGARRAIERQEPARPAGPRLLRDAIRGQLVIEEVRSQARKRIRVC